MKRARQSFLSWPALIFQRWALESGNPVGTIPFRDYVYRLRFLLRARCYDPFTRIAAGATCNLWRVAGPVIELWFTRRHGASMQGLLASHHHLWMVYSQLLAACISLPIIIVIFVPLEHFFAVRKASLFHKGWTANLGWYFFNTVAATALLAPPTALIVWGIHAVVPAALPNAVQALPLWLKMILAMIVGEIGFYWGHRWSHELPLLWRFHAVHHSAEHINFLVNTRAHPIDMVFTRLCGLPLLYATGLASTMGPHPTLIPAMVLFVGSMWSFFIHANVRWRFGLFEEVLATPAFHHWHHTYDDHKDRNYSSMVPVMDRIFGTFYLPTKWPDRYGTSTHMPDRLTGQLLEPFAPTVPRKAVVDHVSGPA
jgi:sterol desaturase/sphingolipid hydroxylase (fatty acid hydroxylase superfamily)